MLPRPCPICELDYGTMQIVVFNKRYYSSRHPIFRIGHYSKRAYEIKTKSHSKTTGPGFSDYEIVQKPVKTRGRIWHSFQIDDSYRRAFAHNVGGKSIPIEDIFELPYLRNLHSKAFAFPSWLFQNIQTNGWQRGHEEQRYRTSPSGIQTLEPRLRRNWKQVDLFKIAHQFSNMVDEARIPSDALVEEMLRDRIPNTMIPDSRTKKYFDPHGNLYTLDVVTETDNVTVF